jgi:hypothetical protein
MITSIPLTAIEIDGRALNFVTALLTIASSSGNWTVDIESLDKRSSMRQGSAYALRLVAGNDLVWNGQATFSDYTADLIPLMTFTGMYALQPASLEVPHDSPSTDDSRASA